MGPTNVFNRDKIITPVVLRFLFQRFSFRISPLKDMELKNFGHMSYMFCEGVTVLKTLMFKKKPLVGNDVCSCTVLPVCVVGQGKAVFTAHGTKNCVMTIDEEYTICLRFPREKR